MQTFEQYLQDIHMSENPELLDDDLPDDFDNWLGTLEQDIMIQYADDYAKECVREYAMKLHIQNEKNKQNTQIDTGAFKYDWAYEEFEEVINTNLK